MTAKGLPFSARGGIFASADALRVPGNRNDLPVASMKLTAHIPVGERTFVDAVLPIGYGTLGNPMVGAHHVFRPADPVWLTLGGAVGFPVLSNDDAGYVFQAASLMWDMQDFAALTMPFVARLGFEAHAGIAEFRVELAPVWGIAVNHHADHLFAFQHAFETQLGHTFGGGVRYQGVLAATNQLGGGSFYSSSDHYQGTFEMFLRLFRDPIYARLGFTLPLDTPFGSDGQGYRSWGVRAQLGWTLD